MSRGALNKAAEKDNTIVEHYLENWVKWQKAGDSSRLGYPKRSNGIVSGGQSTHGVFEEICDDLDRAAAEIIDTLVHDMELHHRGAIYHVWLGCNIIVRNEAEVLSEAYLILNTGIERRGLS
jgi:hypothetical protein